MGLERYTQKRLTPYPNVSLNYLVPAYFDGTLLPLRLASERPIAMACFLLLTFLLLPLFKLPFFCLCIARLTERRAP
jgi:hypothetical protein